MTKPLGLTALSGEQIAQPLTRHLSAYTSDRACERNLFRTNLHAILRVTAIRNPAITHHRSKPLVLMHLSGGMLAHQVNLPYHSRPHKRRMITHLRARFQTASAR